MTEAIHENFALYWTDLVGTTQLVAFQASASGGRLDCELAEDCVYLVGNTVTSFSKPLSTCLRVPRSGPSAVIYSRMSAAALVREIGKSLEASRSNFVTVSASSSDSAPGNSRRNASASVW